MQDAMRRCKWYAECDTSYFAWTLRKNGIFTGTLQCCEDNNERVSEKLRERGNV